MHTRMMVAYSKIHRELTAQVKGSANIMVTVVATQELKAEDVLLRFKAETSQDNKHDGSRYTSAWLAFGNCCYIWDSSHLYAVIFCFCR